MGKGRVRKSTRRDSYQVTPAGTRLYRALTNPELFSLTVTELCEEANISRSTYYRLTRNEKYIEDVKKEQRRVVDSMNLQVLMAADYYGRTEPGNHADRKMMLKWGGEYREEMTTNIKGDIDIRDTSKRLMEFLTSDIEGEDDYGE